ncbi:MAG: transcriptional regulator [Alphaproteobacteria bacterium 64-11]|nr:cupin domain-containing protein [Alphaproteobacteria bacterium]OJU12681.1 MAG: transcriptional regulator [Alphaproteobacteria bacterium 64-11]
MPRIDISAAPVRTGSGYPPPHDEPCRARSRMRLGDAGGLTDFGVNLLTLKPGVWSSQRHWHLLEDEFVYIVSGEVVLVTNKGEELLRAGDCAAFPKNDGDGHHLVNRSDQDAVLLEVGTRSGGDTCWYPDIDLVLDPARGGFVRRDGTPYQGG